MAVQQVGLKHSSEQLTEWAGHNSCLSNEETYSYRNI